MRSSKKNSEKNPSDSLKIQMSKMTTEIENMKKTFDDTCKVLNDPKDGLIVRLTKLETTLSNFKWFIPIGTGIAIFVVEILLKYALP